MPDNNGVQYTNPPQSRNEELLEDIITEQPYTAPPQSEIEEILVSIIDDTPYTKLPTSRNADLLLQVKEKIEEGGGGGSPIILKATFNNTTPAIAYGEIVLLATSATYSGTYKIMWGDDNGVMDNYKEIGTVVLDVTNNKPMASIELTEHNAIPKYATRLCAVQNGSIITSYNIPSAKLWANGNFGNKTACYLVISDPHVQYDTGATDTQVALTYGNEREDVDAIFVDGDLTSNGTTSNLEEWKTLRDTYRGSTPVYSSVGNHEAKNTSAIMYSHKANVRKYLDTDWQSGDDTTAYFLKVINNDVFIFLSIFEDTYQGADKTMFTADELAWLEEKLELYRNQRVFVFLHMFPHWETEGVKYNGFGCGNGAYSFDIWGNPQINNRPLSDRTAFLNLVDHYKNVIWFSGHSHIKYEYQKLWDALNVMQYKGGARFVHLSSLTVPRDIIDGSTSDLIYAESEGTLMDVYENVVRIRCRNFVDEKFYGLCEYIIDTTPVTIPAKSRTLVSISATKVKTSYYTDESTSGITDDITVVATWSDSTTSVVPNSDIVFDTSNVDISTAGTYTIGIAYTYGENTETTSVQVSSVERPVVKTLSYITASKIKTSYYVNEILSTADVSAVAYYSDGSSSNLQNSDLSFNTSGIDMTQTGSYPLVVSYTESEVTETDTISITVSSAPSVNPTIIIDATFNGTLASAGAGMDTDNITINDSKGGKQVYSSACWVYSHDSNAYGKTLYYRLVSDTGIGNGVGFIGGTSNNNHSSSAQAFENYSLDATSWTKLVDGSNNDIQMDSTNGYINIRLKASSSATAVFPVAVNARLQIGYMDT